MTEPNRGALRRQLILRYVNVINRLGRIAIDGQSLRERMTVRGIDFWAASQLRESSPWKSNLFARIDYLRRASAPQTLHSASRLTGVLRALRRVATGWRSTGYLAINLVASIGNRPETVSGDVLFVVFMPASSSLVSDQELLTRYFGRLPRHIQSMGLRSAVLFLPTDSLPSRMTRFERRTRKTMRRELESMTTTSHLSSNAVLRAWRNWLVMRRNAPSVSQIQSRCAQDADLAGLSPLIRHDLEDALFGTSSVRVALLAEVFRSAIKSSRGIRTVIYPFEGQGWESLLESACRAKGIPTVAYLHTIMKPWDLRAHTAMTEVPPQLLATHGPHDREELGHSLVNSVEVEALRYEYLAHLSDHSVGPRHSVQLLVVLGSDCENSAMQLGDLMEEIRRSQVGWQVCVKQHPQCKLPSEAVGLTVVAGSLGEALESSSAVFLCGTAAPLDSYLFGLPTAALGATDGYSMSPLEPDDVYFVGDTAADVVRWLAGAAQRDSRRPDAARYFDLTPGCDKWDRLIRSLVN